MAVVGRLGFSFLIVAAFVAAPAAAVPTRTDPRAAEAQPDPLARLNGELTTFGTWLTRATEIELRVQQQLAGLYPALQQGQTSGEQGIRAYVRRALTEIDAADAELGALELPQLEVLPLPDEMRPATLVAQVRRLNRDIRAVFAGIPPLLDSAGSDPAAFTAGARRLYANMRLIFESQIVLLRAQQAATQRDDVTWEVIGFEVTMLRAAHRIFGAYDPFQASVDRTLSADVVALADELDGNLREARRKLQAELARDQEDLAQAERRGDRAAVRTLQRLIRLTEITADYFPLAERLSAHLRDSAGLLRDRPLSLELLTRVFMPLREMRAALDALTLRHTRELAAPN